MVRDRTQQRVAQDDAAPFDRHQAFVLGRLERVELEPEQRERVDRLGQARDTVGRDHAHREPGRGRQPVEPVAERLADPRPDRQRLHAFGHGHGSDQLRQLEQRERVARRDLQQAIGGRPADPGPVLEQRPGIGVREAGEHELPLGVDPQRDALLAPYGREHGDPLGREPASRERERFHRRLVDPLRIVDAHQHRLGLRELGQQRQQRDADGQRVGGLGVVRQRAVEGVGLGVGQAPDLTDRGPEQLGEAREGQLGLGLDSLRLEHGHAAGLLPRVAQQRGLADPGFAPQDQGPAAASARGRQQRIDAVALGCTTHEHGVERTRPQAHRAVKTW